MSLSDTNPESDSAPWRDLLKLSTSDPPESHVQENGSALARAVNSHPNLLGYVVGELMYQCDQSPQHIDALLNIYKCMAVLLAQEVTAAGFSGAKAAYKELDMEIYENSQSAGVPIALTQPYDVSCPISSTEHLQDAAERVKGWAGARRSWLIVHALHGRQRALRVGLEEQGEEDYALTLVQHALRLRTDMAQPDETNFIGAMILLMTAGHTIASHFSQILQKSTRDAIGTALEARLRSENEFRLKYFIANALRVMQGGKEWTSKELFDPSTWIY